MMWCNFSRFIMHMWVRNVKKMMSCILFGWLNCFSAKEKKFWIRSCKSFSKLDFYPIQMSLSQEFWKNVKLCRKLSKFVTWRLTSREREKSSFASRECVKIAHNFEFTVDSALYALYLHSSTSWLADSELLYLYNV